MTLTSVQAANLSKEQKEVRQEEEKGGEKKKKKQSGDSEVSAVPGPLAFMAH